MVLESPFGYSVELHDRDGRRVASGPGPANASKDHTTVLLLSTVDGAEATLEAQQRYGAERYGAVVPPLSTLDVTQPPARELPDNALHLAGLDAVVIDDFDTSTLKPAQLQALQQYVSLGGSLVVTGGAAGSKTLGSMPPGLAPLRATGTTTASLNPLAELLSQSTTATATVVTGEVRAGRSVLAAPDGPPLVVEADYGAGRVVQLAYDPLAEPIASDQLLRGAAWDQGLSRASNPSYSTGLGDQVWGPTLVERPWPGWPRWQLGLLVLYALIAGPATLLLSRRCRPAVARVAVAVLVTLTAAAGLGSATVRADTAEAVVEVRALGADGSVLTTSYRGLAALSPAERVGLNGAGAASTLYSDQPVFAPSLGAAALAHPSGPQPPLPPGVGQGSVQTRGDSPGLRLAARPWALRTVQTLSVSGGGPTIEAALRVVGASKESPGRVTGTVTNRGREPLRELRAQLYRAQARLPARLAPGETAQVDAPMLAFTGITTEAGATAKPIAPTPEDAAMFAVASRSFTAPGQIAIVGIADPTIVAKRGRTHLTVVVALAGVTGADTVLDGSGNGRNVTASLNPGGTSYGAVEAAVPADAGPLSLRLGLSASPGQPPPPAWSIEIYRWATGTWRSLSTTGHPPVSWVDIPVDEAEVNNGLVRVRERVGPGGRLPGPLLLLPRSTSEASEAALARLFPK